MRITLFDAVSVDSGHGLRPVAARRPRLIVARLVVSCGVVVGDSEIAEAIWGDALPSSHRTAVQGYVGAVRDLLEPDRAPRESGHRIERIGHGYVLHADASEVDFLEFVQCAEQGEAERAARLSTGPFLSEFVGESWVEPHAARVAELRANALERWFGSVLAADGAEVPMADLHDAVDEYPYRERLAAQLMLALYRHGRQQEALAVFSDLRRRLVDSLGVDPGPEIAQLRMRILEHDRDLLASRTSRLEPSAAKSRASVDVPATDESAQAVGVPTHDAEVAPDGLVGRDDAVASVSGLLDTHGTVTVVGPGGIGKTAVAAHVRTLCDGQFAHVAVVDLADLEARTDVVGIADAVATSLGLRTHTALPIGEVVAEVAGDGGVLIVLETCEVAAHAAREAIGAILASVEASSAFGLIATSRHPLGYDGEQVVRLEPLSHVDAMTLITGGSDPDPGDVALLVELVDRLDRVPLSLVMAAPRCAYLGARAVLDDVSSGLLETPSGVIGAHLASDRADRHRSVEAVARWSVDLLDETQREVAARLCAFVGDVPLSAVTAVFGETTNGRRLVDVIAELVEVSIVLRRPGEPARFHVLEAVRGCFAGSPLLERAEETIADAIVAWAWSSAGTTTGSAGSVGSDDHWVVEQLPAATDLLITTRDPRRHVVTIAAAATWIERGEMSMTVRSLDRSLSTADVPDVVVAASCSMIAFALVYEGNFQESRRWVERAIVGAEGDATIPGVLELCRSTLAWIDGDFRAAWNETRPIVDELAAVPRFAPTLLAMAGNFALWADERASAARCYERCRSSARRSGDRLGEANGLRLGAVTAALAGDDDAGWRWARRAVAMIDDLGTQMWLGQSAATMAAVARLGGDDREAARWARRSLEIARRQFDVFTVTVALPVWCAHVAEEGDLAEAARLLGWHDQFLEDLHHHPHPTAVPILVGVRAELDGGLSEADQRRVRAEGASSSAAEILRSIAASALD